MIKHQIKHVSLNLLSQCNVCQEKSTFNNVKLKQIRNLNCYEDMDLTTGLTFDEARKKVIDCMRKCIEQHQRESIHQHKHERDLFIYLFFPVLLSLLFLGLSLTEYRKLGHGILLSFCIIVVISLGNLVLVKSYRQTEKCEIKNALIKILKEYDLLVSSVSKHDVTDQAFDALYSGHPHVSIVTAYRNREWHRIPTLLLAEGDVIALMAGDITPAKVLELKLSGVSGRTSCSGGFVIKAGVKIHLSDDRQIPSRTCSRVPKMESRRRSHTYESDMNLRASPRALESSRISKNNDLDFPHRNKSGKISNSTKHQSASAPSRKKSFSDMHRHGGNCICYESISSDSPELLGLSGDLRCFKVMETPIQEFCTSALLKNAYDRDERGDVVNSRVTQKREYFTLFPLRRSVPIASNDGHGSESVLRMLFQVDNDNFNSCGC